MRISQSAWDTENKPERELTANRGWHIGGALMSTAVSFLLGWRRVVSDEKGEKARKERNQASEKLFGHAERWRVDEQVRRRTSKISFNILNIPEPSMKNGDDCLLLNTRDVILILNETTQYKHTKDQVYILHTDTQRQRWLANREDACGRNSEQKRCLIEHSLAVWTHKIKHTIANRTELIEIEFQDYRETTGRQQTDVQIVSRIFVHSQNKDQRITVLIIFS